MQQKCLKDLQLVYISAYAPFWILLLLTFLLADIISHFRKLYKISYVYLSLHSLDHHDSHLGCYFRSTFNNFLSISPLPHINLKFTPVSILLFFLFCIAVKVTTLSNKITWLIKDKTSINKSINITLTI